MGLGPRRAPLTHDLTHDTHDVCVFLKPLGPIPRSSYLHAYLIYTYQLLCKLQPPHTARPSSSTLHQALSEGELPPPVATRALWDADLEDAGLVPPSEPAAVLRAPDTTSASCSAKFSKRDAAFPTSWSQLVAIEAKKFFPSRSLTEKVARVATPQRPPATRARDFAATCSDLLSGLRARLAT